MIMPGIMSEGSGPLYLRARARLSRKTAQSGRARHPPVLLRHCLWGTRSAAPRTPATRCRVVCLAVKPVGEPDSGNALHWLHGLESPPYSSVKQVNHCEIV